MIYYDSDIKWGRKSIIGMIPSFLHLFLPFFLPFFFPSFLPVFVPSWSWSMFSWCYCFLSFFDAYLCSGFLWSITILIPCSHMFKGSSERMARWTVPSWSLWVSFASEEGKTASTTTGVKEQGQQLSRRTILIMCPCYTPAIQQLSCITISNNSKPLVGTLGGGSSIASISLW